MSNPRGKPNIDGRVSKSVIGDLHIIHPEAEAKIVSCLSLGNRCHLSSKNIMCNLPYRFKCSVSLTTVVESKKAKVLYSQNVMTGMSRSDLCGILELIATVTSGVGGGTLTITTPLATLFATK